MNLGITVFIFFSLRRYIIRYTVTYLVVWQHASEAVKHDFQPFIQRYTSPNENFEYGYPHSNALLQFLLKLEHCKRHKAAHNQTQCDIINDINYFGQDIQLQIFDLIQSDFRLQKQVH